jgi:hypothetical protein
MLPNSFLTFDLPFTGLPLTVKENIITVKQKFVGLLLQLDIYSKNAEWASDNH